MGMYPKAHLIYGYKVTEGTYFNFDDDELFEKYEDPTDKEPGFIWDYDKIKYFGLLINECDEGESSIVKSNIDLEIDISTKYKVKEAMAELTKNQQIENPKLYLTCLWH